MPITPISLHTVNVTLQALPLALIYTTRLLLTENCSLTEERFSSTVTVEIPEEIPGYRHGGIND